MIYDVHSHTWRYPDHFTETFRQQAVRMRGHELDWTTEFSKYRTTAQTADHQIKTVIFGQPILGSVTLAKRGWPASGCRIDMWLNIAGKIPII